MATSIPQAGTRMSLISKGDIRYEGVLSHIDMGKSEICLTQVQSFGTEDRPAVEYVAPSSEKYDCIIFKGADIKDLTVLDQQPPEGYLSSAPAQAGPPPAPPAPQAPGAPPAPSPWDPPQQQYSGGPQWGPPQAPSGPAGGPPQPPYYPQAGGAPPQSAPTPAYADGKPQPAQAPPLPAGTARPQPAPAPTVVITPARAPRAPPPPQQPHPPAPRGPPHGPSAHGPPGLQQQPQANGPPPAQMPNGGPPARHAPQDGSAQGLPRRPPPSYANAAGGGRRGRGRGPPMPGGRGPMPPQGRGPPGRGPGRSYGEALPPRAPPVPVPAEDFNFEEGIQKFNKEEVKPEVQSESAPNEKVYEKDDFFDQLSCEALERLNVGGEGGPQQSRPPPRARFAEQRKLDIETFGGTGIARRNNFGRGRGRRGRGGPGGGAGRGRGRGPPPAQAPPVPAA